jgi:hypothetical protein
MSQVFIEDIGLVQVELFDVREMLDQRQTGACLSAASEVDRHDGFAGPLLVGLDRGAHFGESNDERRLFDIRFACRSRG